MSKGGVGGVVAWWLFSEGGGERQKEASHLVVKNEWFEGCCDAGDVIVTAKSASSASRGAQVAMEREQIVVAAKLSVAVGLKRALPMRWEFT